MAAIPATVVNRDHDGAVNKSCANARHSNALLTKAGIQEQ